MIEVHPEVHGLTNDIPGGVHGNEESEPRSIEDLQKEWYYAWQNSCRDQEQVIRDRYAKKPGHLKNEEPIWERDGVSEYDRFRTRLAHDYVKFKQEGKEFSPAALGVTLSLESATFFDDVKWGYLGASDRPGSFPEISPAHNQTPFDVQFNYNIGVLNAYTPSGNIIHIRETDDPAAKTRDQRQLVLTMNVLTREVKRYHPEDKTIITPNQGTGNRYDEMVTLQSRFLSSAAESVEIGPQNLFPTVYQNAMDQAARQGLAKILYSGNDTLHFKREGFAETFESLCPIAELDRERHLLSGLARAAGIGIGERNVIRDPRLHSRIAA